MSRCQAMTKKGTRCTHTGSLAYERIVCAIHLWVWQRGDQQWAVDKGVE